MIARVLVAAYVTVHAGNYNVMPTDLDVYAPERWVGDALFRPEVREGLIWLRLLGTDGSNPVSSPIFSAGARQAACRTGFVVIPDESDVGIG